MRVTAYLAGPDVLLPNGVEHTARKVACQRFGFRGLPPLNQDVETAANELKAWLAIFKKDVAMMECSDIIIANLTPFGGGLRRRRHIDRGRLVSRQGQADLLFEHP